MNYLKFTNFLQSSHGRKIAKLFVATYSLYFIFSTPAFAQQAEAPHHKESIIATEQELDAVNSFFEDETISLESLKSEDPRVTKIRAYYDRFNLPLAEEAETFVSAADRYDINWTLLAAIGMIESTGGKHACSKADYSAFGWGSCKIDFDSYAESIDRVSLNLGGFNPKTARYYKDKTIREKLEAYNPPSIVPDYADRVIKEMKKIESI